MIYTINLPCQKNKVKFEMTLEVKLPWQHKRRKKTLLDVNKNIFVMPRELQLPCRVNTWPKTS